jgi:hypothetical protein
LNTPKNFFQNPFFRGREVSPDDSNRLDFTVFVREVAEETERPPLTT